MFWSWLTSHREDILVNVISSIPFLLIDLIVIALVLPQAILWLQRRRTRVARSEALKMVGQVYLRSLYRLVSFTETAEPGGFKRALLKELEAERQAIDNAVPPLFALLDGDEVRLCFALRQTWENLARSARYYTPREEGGGLSLSLAEAMLAVDRAVLKLNPSLVEFLSHPHGRYGESFHLSTRACKAEIERWSKALQSQRLARAAAREAAPEKTEGTSWERRL